MCAYSDHSGKECRCDGAVHSTSMWRYNDVDHSGWEWRCNGADHSGWDWRSDGADHLGWLWASGQRVLLPCYPRGKLPMKSMLYQYIYWYIFIYIIVCVYICECMYICISCYPCYPRGKFPRKQRKWIMSRYLFAICIYIYVYKYVHTCINIFAKCLSQKSSGSAVWRPFLQEASRGFSCLNRLLLDDCNTRVHGSPLLPACCHQQQAQAALSFCSARPRQSTQNAEKFWSSCGVHARRQRRPSLLCRLA